MFITGGRAGQVMYIATLVILIFQYFNNEKIKSLLLIMLIIPSILFTAYNTSELFKNRVNFGVSDVLQYSQNKNTSIGLRINFALNSFEIIKKNPILGVGTGDFPDEYKIINSIKSPNLPNVTNPHNMYALVFSQLGLLGLISMLSIFYYQFRLSVLSDNKFIRDVGFAMPLLFLIIMWSDSYLLGHYTALVYVFFSAFLYKDFEKT
tara:strand:- start:222 stop:842 length:621 start_codon:yes stop_codon:yes gene_type:complete